MTIESREFFISPPKSQYSNSVIQKISLEDLEFPLHVATLINDDVVVNHIYKDYY